MAADDMRRIEEDGDLRVFMQSIESLENGGLKFSFHFMLHTEGVDVAIVRDKTDKNGEYAITLRGVGLACKGMGSPPLPPQAPGEAGEPAQGSGRRAWGPCPWLPGDAGTGGGLGKAEQSFHADLGENRLQVLEAYYLWYMTFRLQNFRNRTETQVLALYGRFPELKPSFLDRFEKICKSHGLGPENIVNLSNNGRTHCLPASSLGKREAPGGVPSARPRRESRAWGGGGDPRETPSERPAVFPDPCRKHRR
ncbi:LOW QUALITY PROTEIN: epididymal-specific lipocalin-9-like [Megaptera novaeangliae]